MSKLQNKGRQKKNVQWDERAYIGRKYYCKLSGEVVTLLSTLTLVFQQGVHRVVRTRDSVVELSVLERYMLGIKK